MELTEEQLQKVKEKIKFKKTCPNCDTPIPVLYGNKVLQLNSFEREGREFIADKEFAYVPTFPIICPSCGYIRLYDLQALGVITE